MYQEEQYIRLMGQRLERFKFLGRNRYQCRCPFCGDSKTDKKKARGSFYVWKGSWMYNCFNCPECMPVQAMLQRLFPDMYDDYIMGKKLAESPCDDTTQSPRIRTPGEFFPEIKQDLDLPKLSDLPSDHQAVTYIQLRKLPDKYIHDLYYAEHFKEFSNSVVPDTFKNTDFDDGRIVIPFRNKDRAIFAFQGRSLLKNSRLKYLTVKIDPTAKKIFGLDRVNMEIPFYVVEGPFDSMFLKNAVATSDSGLSLSKFDNPNAIFVWDNEPRSKQISKKMEMAIESGKSIVIWKPETKFNDINDAFQNYGYESTDIENLLAERTFKGLAAELELNYWKKI